MFTEYEELGKRIIKEGKLRENRTGIDTIAKFGERVMFDLAEGFPIPTTKKVDYTKPILELLWFLRGPEDGKNMNVKWLNEQGVKFWDLWADKEGSIGPCYGSTMRGIFKDESGNPIDQMSLLMEGLKSNPFSRRHVVSLWHPAYLPDEKQVPKDNPALGKGSLAPCFWNYVFDVEPGEDKNILNVEISSRSSDYAIGLPFNIVQFAALTHMIAQQLDMEPGKLLINITNAHIYVNHLENLEEQLKREPFPLSELKLLNKPKDIFSYDISDFQLNGYEYHEPVKYTPAV